MAKSGQLTIDIAYMVAMSADLLQNTVKQVPCRMGQTRRVSILTGGRKSSQCVTSSSKKNLKLQSFWEALQIRIKGELMKYL